MQPGIQSIEYEGSIKTAIALAPVNVLLGIAIDKVMAMIFPFSAFWAATSGQLISSVIIDTVLKVPEIIRDSVDSGVIIAHSYENDVYDTGNLLFNACYPSDGSPAPSSISLTYKYLIVNGPLDSRDVVTNIGVSYSPRLIKLEGMEDFQEVTGVTAYIIDQTLPGKFKHH